jgi:MFS family permease
VIALTILFFASFMVVLGYIIPSIAEDDHIGFGASGQTTALLFITPASAVQLVVAPFIGRLAVKIGFVTVLRAGLVCAIVVTSLLAVFAFDRHMVTPLMAAFGIVLATCLTPIAALGVLQAPKDEPGSLPGIANAAFGIGGSIGFAWAGTVVAQGTKAGFQSALWICVAIGVATLATSLILKPRPLVTTDSIPQLTH